MHISKYISRRVFVWSSNLIGLIGIAWFAFSTINNDGVLHSKAIFNNLNIFVEDVDAFYDSQFKSLVMPDDCETFRKRAAIGVYSSSTVRSIGWTQQGIVLCSTLSGYEHITLPSSAIQSHGPRMFFSPMSPYSKDLQDGEKGVIIISRQVAVDTYVDFGIHPGVVQRLLENAQRNVNSYVEIGGYVIGDNYISKASSFNLSLKRPLYSNDFVRVYYHYSMESYLIYLLEHFGLVMCLWCIVCTIGSKEVYKNIRSFNWMTIRIKQGIKREEFHPYLQPIFDHNMKLIGAEVLVRWLSPSKGVIAPDQFVEIAEKNGQIGLITTQLFEKVTQALSTIPTGRVKPLHIAFNICPVQLSTQFLFNECEQFINRFSGDHHTLVVEITEREALPDDSVYLNAVNRLKNMGVKIALDDFGTGHCSLKYLLQMDIDYLKIDKSYVEAIGHGVKVELLDNVIDLAQRLKVPTIAEGVEDEDELNYLLDRRVDYYQGYYFDKPLPMNEFINKYLE